MKHSVSTINYSPSFIDQAPGTSGLRKKVKVFQSPNYSESFINASLVNVSAKSSLLVGGDGRYWCKEIAQLIVKQAAAHRVRTVYVAKDAILSTPAASCLVRKLGISGAFLLTASHNPGGPDADFGIKYNCENGGPAPEKVTSAIFTTTCSQTSYPIVDSLPLLDLAKLGEHNYEVIDGAASWTVVVKVIDAVKDYCDYMMEIFDFPLMKSFITRSNFHVLFDSMNGVTGPYSNYILVDLLGLDPSCVMNGIPLPDFGGIHPDPNLTYAKDLVDKCWQKDSGIDLGAASDGDGDRNMIVAKDGVFVNPSDSVAVIAANAHLIPYFKKTGLKGFARSMPTSAAIDRVGEKKGIKVYEVPTGWKFFGNLMDANKLSICGEESFGTSSDHIREKDGIWAVLAWLNILAAINEPKNPGDFIGIKYILESHYETYGRNYFTRYDYEEVSSEGGAKLMSALRTLVSPEGSGGFVGEVYTSKNGESYRVAKCGDFKYTDPVDGSVSEKQGVFVVFEDGSRIVFRASGTGSSGATIRTYVEKYEKSNWMVGANEALEGLVEIALGIGRIVEFTGRETPTVIT